MQWFYFVVVVGFFEGGGCNFFYFFFFRQITKGNDRHRSYEPCESTSAFCWFAKVINVRV